MQRRVYECNPRSIVHGGWLRLDGQLSVLPSCFTVIACVTFYSFYITIKKETAMSSEFEVCNEMNTSSMCITFWCRIMIVVWIRIQKKAGLFHFSYTGLTDRMKERKFRWVDGRPLSFSSWYFDRWLYKRVIYSTDCPYSRLFLLSVNPGTV